MNRKTSPRKTAVTGKLATASESAISRLMTWIAGTFRGQSKEFNQLLSLTIILVIIGSVMVLSASYVDALKSGGGALSIFLKQIIAALGGLFLMGVLSRTPSFALKKLTKPFTYFVLGAQGFVFIFGTAVNGNKNWISVFGLFTLQPSEFLKLAMILSIALLLCERNHFLDNPAKTWWPALTRAGIAMVAVMLGSDLGTVIVMFLIVIVLLSVAGLPRRIFGTIMVALAVLLPIAVNASSSRKARILAWLNPNAPDPLDVNWQAKHGIWALASGGLSGTGLGESKMKWSWIPEVENDFIFAIIGEELGLLGAVAVIALFIWLGLTLVKIILKTRDVYDRYLLIGIMAWIVLQSLVNIGVVLNFLPVLGVPLPLISAGGSSMLATLMAIGVALGVERRNSNSPVISRTRTRDRR